MDPAERLEAAMSAVVADEEANPWTDDMTVAAISDQVLGALPDDKFKEFISGVVGAYAVYTGMVGGCPYTGAYLTFLAGVKLGRQLGIGEGMDALMGTGPNDD